MSTSQPGAHAGAGAPQTLAQKLVARAAGRTEVTVGEIVVCRIDVAMFHDSSGPRRLKPMLEQLGATIWDRSRVVLITDHYVPEKDEEARQILRMTREWASAMALPHFYDNMGICHIVLPEQGHLRPGLFCVGGDSHSTTGGAFGAYMFGVGATEMLGAVTTGEIWVQVPPTLEMRWNGRLAPGVSAKDMMLHMIGRFGMNGGNYGAVEFSGEAVRALGMQERMTLSNMSAELGAQVGLVAPDDTTAIWLRDIGARAAEPGEWFTDPGGRHGSSPVQRGDAFPPDRRAAQPGQYQRRGGNGRDRRGCRLHRCLHRGQAGGSAGGVPDTARAARCKPCGSGGRASERAGPGASAK